MRAGEALQLLMDERSRICAAAAAAQAEASADDCCFVQVLHDHALALREAMTTYTDLEDTILPDILRDADAWGTVRLERMQNEHRERRLVLDRVLESIDARPTDPSSLRTTLIDLANEILRELAIEETEVVSRDVLCDDVAVLDAMTG
jgi:hypothetical protein